MLFGSIVALVTPYFEDGGVDIATLKELVEWQIDAGSDGIVVCGTTGEGWALSSQEKLSVLEAVIDAGAKRVPILMNSGTCSTRESVEMTRLAKELGADAALVIVPYYNKPTFAGCRAHFAAVADEGLPVMLYHHPGRTGTKLSARELLDLGEYVSSYKEASDDMLLLRELLQGTEHPVFSGNDSTSGQIMRWGGKGSISVIANAFPKEWKDFIHGTSENTVASFVETLQGELNPQGIKALMGIMGRCRPDMRLPLVPATLEIVERLSQQVNDHSLLFQDNQSNLI
jgi:4-hydroxy-tetrahydrodipicolinate synthase